MKKFNKLGKLVIFIVLIGFGFQVMFTDSEVIKEMLSTVLFYSASVLFLLFVLKAFKEAFTGNGKGL